MELQECSETVRCSSSGCQSAFVCSSSKDDRSMSPWKTIILSTKKIRDQVCVCFTTMMNEFLIKKFSSAVRLTSDKAVFRTPRSSSQRQRERTSQWRTFSSLSSVLYVSHYTRTTCLKRNMHSSSMYIENIGMLPFNIQSHHFTPSSLVLAVVLPLVECNTSIDCHSYEFFSLLLLLFVSWKVRIAFSLHRNDIILTLSECVFSLIAIWGEKKGEKREFSLLRQTSWKRN